MTAGFIWALTLAPIGVALWIASFVLFQKNAVERAGWFVAGVLGNVVIAAAVIAAVVGVIQLVAGFFAS